MLIEHDGKAPTIDPSARIAPTAVVCGDPTIGAGTSVGFGAVLTAETGPITIGSKCVIMENAVLQGTKRHPLSISNNVLIGPHVHLTGCTIAENVFIATQVAIFNGQRLENAALWTNIPAPALSASELSDFCFATVKLVVGFKNQGFRSANSSFTESRSIFQVGCSPCDWIN
jgi:tetrahydrodipicolinate N-succinyltransferase